LRLISYYLAQSRSVSARQLQYNKWRTA
jgi:hypothetical protein